MNRAGIFIKRKDKRAAHLAGEIVDWLVARGWECFYEEESYDDIRRPGGTSKAEMVRTCDLIIVLGGDGTMLAAARALDGRATPVLGCNLGSLGFLTEITVEEVFQTLEAYLRGDCDISRRMLLRVTRQMENGQTSRSFRVLNDVVVAKSAIARILDLEVRVDGRFVNNYKSDGLIVATPTGSTAYSLAAGGPLVHPTNDCIILTPLAPHALTARAIVLAPESRVEVQLVSETSEVFATLDGQEGFPMRPGQVLEIIRSEREFLLVSNPKRNFYDICRTKLKWGER